MTTHLLTTAQAAAYLGISVRTLQDWRYKRTGPVFIRRGRIVRYSPAALNAWMTRNEVQTSA